MAKYTPTPINTLTNEQAAVAQINENLSDIAAAMNDQLDRVSGLPNHMQRDLDMNGNDILNVGFISFGNGTVIGGNNPWPGSDDSGAVQVAKAWTFTGNGTQKDFVIAGADVTDELFYDVAVNGVAQNPGTDYDIVVGGNTNNSLIRFTNAIPNGIVGFAVLRAAGNAASLIATAQVPVVTIAGTSATLDNSYRQAHILCTNAAPVTLTVRANNGTVSQDWKTGDYFTVVQKGTGQVTVNTAAGVTFQLPTGYTPKTRVRYSVVSFVCDDASTNTWTVGNDMAAV